MPAGAVVGGIAVASSVAGTVATVSAQQRNARLQEEASLQQALDAEERAQLAVSRQAQIVESAKILRQRELQLIGSQRRQAALSLQQNILNNKLAQLQTGLQANTLRAQGQATALSGEQQGQQVMMGAETEAFNREMGMQNQLAGRTNELIGATGQTAQASLQGANELSQAQQGFQQAEQGGQQLAQQGRGNTSAGLSAQEQMLGQAQDVVGQTNVNAQQQTGTAQFNQQMAQRGVNLAQRQLALEQQYGNKNRFLASQFANTLQQIAASQGQLTNLAATSLEAQQSFDDAALGSSNAYQRNINRLQTQRNRQSVQAGYQSSVATGSLSALGQVIQEKGNISNALYQAQQARAQAPSGLSYLGALANGVSSAYQLGLFGRGGLGGSTGSATQAPLPYYGASVGALSATSQIYSPTPVQQGTPRPGLINTYPPASNNLINTYPPGYNLINTYPPGYNGTLQDVTGNIYG